ncbi:MAG: hypothetical protein KDA45_16590, partial [Planctomycetales bacterium]|nr:hypothetical protein [Planctomycetales bacterium]
MLIWGMRTATSLLGSVLAAAGMAASGLAEEGDTGNNSPEVGRIAGAPSGLGRPIRVQRDLVFRQV